LEKKGTKQELVKCNKRGLGGMVGDENLENTAGEKNTQGRTNREKGPPRESVGGKEGN